MSEVAPNPDDFSVDEKPREYRATLRVEGSMTLHIKADSKEEARQKAEDMADKISSDADEADLDEVDDVSVDFVWKYGPMYRVTRDDRKMQVSRLLSGDMPREPDERGF